MSDKTESPVGKQSTNSPAKPAAGTRPQAGPRPRKVEKVKKGRI